MNASFFASYWQKIPQHRQNDEVLVKFAVSCFICAGPLAYNFIQSNVSLHCQAYVQYNERWVYELLVHLTEYKSPLLDTIGEDATRLISRIDYDSQTDCSVGYVLPLDESGLPVTDKFLAVSFKAIENCFSTATIAKYAFLYMTQLLVVAAPSFILARDNCFSTEHMHVLKRWKYIGSEYM